MLEKNYIINQFQDSVSPKFLRQQKYLRKIEYKLFQKNHMRKKKIAKPVEVDMDWQGGYLKRSQIFKAH